MTARLVNRRIRLLVGVFACIFAATFARAAWLQAVEARGLNALATSQHREALTVPARKKARTTLVRSISNNGSS